MLEPKLQGSVLKVGAFGRWLGHEGSIHPNVINTLVKEASERVLILPSLLTLEDTAFLHPFCYSNFGLFRTHQQGATMEAQSSPQCQQLDLGLISLQSGRNALLSFIHFLV
jgi:hypothetical protein